ncbi:oligosaccharide flippase family protein [Haloplanus aerogenes]|uniref:O-antigen/teichoic acid export membrane protein n=1 Tax=Haloplanus aerogenes TaxID=660522 RepID=A0A3M0D8Y5_9EURY|nr:oligosaccharide flippase family protein [Haloplanus aerogenes]AZH26330.1 polysaccharide biosynthesis protein [Haloplanus aerogenes]RMB18211.1 O-antigen/teichoic acid export membrane protein [Haloplanus aerogenes]
MRIGQTSLIVFVSKIAGSIAGFVATLYFARELGAGVLGTYSLVLAVVAWVGIGGKVGVTAAIRKRMSEGEDQAEFFTAGLCLMIGMFAVLSLVLYLLRNPVAMYIGEPVTGFVVLILFATLLNSMSGATLAGSHLVHVQGVLTPVRMTVRSLTQIGLVFLGLGLTGMLAGHAVGYALIGAVGVWLARPSLRLPARHHFAELFSYAKFAWLGSVERRTFGWVDVAVLGLFVTSDLIGVYSVAWTISTFLLTFGTSISSATFPEISNTTADAANQAAAPILEDSLRYAGLILIPGLVGTVILGSRILRIYGTEFTVGETVLTLLVAAVLLRSYQKQLITTLGAIDRPDLTFNVNAAFIGTNTLLNLGLVYLYGWVGAAVATALSAGIGTLLAYQYVMRLIDFDFPYRTIGKQVVAAAVCGAVAYGGLWIEETYKLLQHNFALVLLLVCLGAGAYFAVLFGISAEFRSTIRDNLPAKLVAVIY